MIRILSNELRMRLGWIGKTKSKSIELIEVEKSEETGHRLIKVRMNPPATSNPRFSLTENGAVALCKALLKQINPTLLGTETELIELLRKAEETADAEARAVREALNRV